MGRSPQLLTRITRETKKWYDAKSVLRSLNVGYRALILLPSCENKLLAQWQGPYEVLEQVNATTYKLAFPHGQGREQIYHINLFKKWQEPTDVQPIRYITNVTTDEIPYLSFPTQHLTEDSCPQTNPTLTETHHRQLIQVIEKYHDVFSKRPGRTQLAEHPIRTSVLTEQSAPFEDGRRETPRKLVVPIGDEECRLRGAERDYPPRSRRSAAKAGAWQWPEQG
ncbi:hypothetical protein NDU88_004075 [Pleurodeles waltl]|uniref:Reverse transcriptase RNase H-like domain-containing protein n=1 Tax=Pleurodeles waltl TaxID=8319 RepID=A0AAV7RI32_PLEWA|nr:hypothetical protein NDU88_004075 [Pleurodeles waltl]